MILLVLIASVLKDKYGVDFGDYQDTFYVDHHDLLAAFKAGRDSINRCENRKELK